MVLLVEVPLAQPTHTMLQPDVHNATAFTASINSCCRVLLCQCPRFVLAPHIYPTSITGAVDEIAAAIETITYRWDQSWGWKMQGTDTTYQVRSVIVRCAFFMSV